MPYLLSFLIFLSGPTAHAGLPMLSQPSRNAACYLALSVDETRQSRRALRDENSHAFLDSNAYDAFYQNYDETSIYSGRDQINRYLDALQAIEKEFENGSPADSRVLATNQKAIFVGFNLLAAFGGYNLVSNLLQLPDASAVVGIFVQSVLLGVTGPVNTNRRWFVRDRQDSLFRKQILKLLALNEDQTRGQTISQSSVHSLDLSLVRAIISSQGPGRNWVRSAYNGAAINESSSAVMRFVIQKTSAGHAFALRSVLVDQSLRFNPATNQPELVVRVRVPAEPTQPTL